MDKLYDYCFQARSLRLGTGEDYDGNVFTYHGIIEHDDYTFVGYTEKHYFENVPRYTYCDLIISSEP